MNENRRNTKSTGIADLMHLIASQVEATQSGRIVSFGNGRLSTHVQNNSVEISIEEIRNSEDQSNNENDEQI